MYEQSDSIDALKESMLNLYGDTYDNIMEKINKYTSRMEYLNEVLDHYSNVVNLLGKKKDYNLVSTILTGKRDVAEDSFNTSSAIYN
jgi:hypothetical protein